MNRLHPLAWLAIAAGLAVTVVASTNWLLGVVALAGVCLVAWTRGGPRTAAFLWAFAAGAAGFVAQLALGAMVGGDPATSRVLVTLPVWDPGTGVSLGGPFTAEALAVAVERGLDVWVLCAVVGLLWQACPARQWDTLVAMFFGRGARFAATQGVLAFGSTTYAQVVFPKVVGEACEGTEGVTVIVDLAYFDGTIQQRCAEGEQENGWTALENAGFALGSVPGFEGGAICTIDDLPKAGYPECWYNGFWSYYHSENNDGPWEFSNWGAANRTPPAGSVEGWRYEPDLYNHMAVAPGIPAPTHSDVGVAH